MECNTGFEHCAGSIPGSSLMFLNSGNGGVYSGKWYCSTYKVCIYISINVYVCMYVCMYACRHVGM